jgi:DNA-binding transcriptional regulator GbsR (MarR family)
VAPKVFTSRETEMWVSINNELTQVSLDCEATEAYDARMADGNLLRAVDRFAQTLELSGMPRMAARVFAYVLAEDSDRYTATQLAEGLQVSPAAVSGALRYLLDARLLFREREPGNRSDLFRVYDDDVWRAIISARIPLLEHFITALDPAIDLLAPGSRGRRRMEETREFFRFMMRETANMLERWSVYREQHLAAP